MARPKITVVGAGNVGATVAIRNAQTLVIGAATNNGSITTSNGTIIFDAGAARGVQPGDGFVVFRRGREITHPTTKKRLGFEKTPVAVVEVTTSDADLSKAKIVTLADPAVVDDLVNNRQNKKAG